MSLALSKASSRMVWLVALGRQRWVSDKRVMYHMRCERDMVVWRRIVRLVYSCENMGPGTQRWFTFGRQLGCVYVCVHVTECVCMHVHEYMHACLCL